MNSIVFRTFRIERDNIVTEHDARHYTNDHYHVLTRVDSLHDKSTMEEALSQLQEAEDLCGEYTVLPVIVKE